MRDSLTPNDAERKNTCSSSFRNGIKSLPYMGVTRKRSSSDRLHNLRRLRNPLLRNIRLGRRR